MAVGAGLLLTVAFYLKTSASDVRVRELIRLDDGRIAESKPPARLAANAVTVLDVDGSLFFAGARTLADALPNPTGAARPVVVLRLRGYTRVGATLVEVLDNYADALAEVGGRLYLSGVDPQVGKQLRRAGKLDLDRVVHLVAADDTFGTSTEQAVAHASSWLGSTHNDPSADGPLEEQTKKDSVIKNKRQQFERQ